MSWRSVLTFLVFEAKSVVSFETALCAVLPCVSLSQFFKPFILLWECWAQDYRCQPSHLAFNEQFGNQPQVIR